MSYPDRESCGLYLLIDHPSINPEQISIDLELEPQLTQKVGELVTTPAGTHPGGSYTGSKWQYIRNITTRGDLGPSLDSLILHLNKHQPSLRKYKSEGARISVFFRTLNSEHVFISVLPGQLDELSKLEIDFGFEVFTHEYENQKL